SGLAARIAAERKRLSMGSSELQAAVTCYNVVLQLRVALGTRPQDFPILIQEGERLRKALADLFDSGSTAELLQHLSAAELAGPADRRRGGRDRVRRADAGQDRRGRPPHRPPDPVAAAAPTRPDRRAAVGAHRRPGVRGGSVTATEQPRPAPSSPSPRWGEGG